MVAMNATTLCDDSKHDDGTFASRTVDCDSSFDYSSSTDSNGQPNVTGHQLRCSFTLTSPSSSKVPASTARNTPNTFDVSNGASSQHRGGMHSLQLPTKTSPSNRHGMPNSILKDGPTLATETNRMRTARKLAEFSQSSLDFSRISLIGREKEKRVLDRLFQQILKKPTSAISPPSSSSSDEERSTGPNDEESNAIYASNATNPDNQNALGQHVTAQAITVRSLVSISGYSGTGKSALANTLQPKCKASNVFFVSGKFDLKQMDEPYSGFRTAIADLCSQICALPRTNSAGVIVTPGNWQSGGQDTRSFDVIRQRITDGLNVDELQALTKIIPNLVDVVGSDALCHAHAQDNDGDESTVLSASQRAQTTEGFKEQSIRLKFAFRRFIKIICSCCPLVWVSDDVQWADKESLNMIESWMLDTTISSLMVVICFRSNLVNMEGASNGRASDLASVATSHTADLVGQMLSSIQKKKRQRFIRYVDLEVNNLSLDNVHGMVKQLLGIYADGEEGSEGCDNGTAETANSSSSSYGLAEIAYKKTDGNVFFVQQFIRMLVKDTQLSYDIASMKWVWDNDQIKRETPATINVVELMELKLQQIDTAKYLLPLAACLGSTFSWLLLRTALEGFVANDAAGEDGHRALYEMLFGGPPPATENEWLGILKIYEEEGLIEAHTTTDKAHAHLADESSLAAQTSTAAAYSFIHDKVQEAALGMIASKVHLLELQHRIGLILMDRLSLDDFESSLFVVVNLLNSRLDMVPLYPSSLQSSASLMSTEGTDITQTRRFQVAKLNFDAGTIAASHAAFRPAFRYFQNAIDMMPADHWRSQYNMSLQLFSSAAECAYVSNRFDKMKKYGNEVIKQTDSPLIDKMRAYHVLMEGDLAMIQQTKASDVLNLGTELMAKLGYRYPKNSTMRLFTVITKLMKLKASAKKWTVEYLDSMQPSEDPMDELIMNTIDRHGWSASICDPGILTLIMVDSINNAMTTGRTSFTPIAIVSLGMLLGPILGDMEAGGLYANYAMKMNETNSNSAAARATMVAYGMVINNLIPYEDCKQPLLDAHPQGMAGGDTQIAMWAILFYLDLCLLTAKPLEGLDADFSTYTKVCEDYSQHKPAEQLSIRWQMVLNLRGRSDQQTLLVGEVFNEALVMERIKQTKDEALWSGVLQIRLFTATYFGDYEYAVKIVIEAHDNGIKFTPGNILSTTTRFLSSLVATIVGHQNKQLSRSKRSKIKQLAHTSRKALRLAVKQKNPNAVHCLAILEAERAAWKAHKKRKRDSEFRAAVKLYQDAIRISARTGSSQNQALANERLGEHMLLESDTEGAVYHFNEAVRLYQEWGASQKAALLQERSEFIGRP